MRNWTLQERGFLPTPDPLRTTDWHDIENLARSLPRHIADGKVREAVWEHCASAQSRPSYDLGEYLRCYNERGAERLMMLYSYFASAYIHGRDAPCHELPAPIARPLVRLARHVGRPPILSYASYCLNNWVRIDPEGPIALGNIRLLQNFSEAFKRDEDWFILVHVDIEARAGDALHCIDTAYERIAKEDLDSVQALLENTLASLTAMNVTLARMPEQCSPEVYCQHVRPYIFGFENVVYKGCFDDEPQSFRGETGAQSSIIPAVIRGMGIRHKDSMLTRHLDDMLNYMPPAHRAFVERQGKNRNFRDIIFQSLMKLDNRHQAGHLRDAYNSCVGEVIKFRQQHLEYAVNYIQRRVSNPTGTGGTPYVPWLKQLVEETEAFYIR